MTIPRMELVAKRWQVLPPLSVLVARIGAALGVKLESEKPSGGGDSDNLQELVDMMGLAGLSSEKPAWLNQT